MRHLSLVLLVTLLASPVSAQRYRFTAEGTFEICERRFPLLMSEADKKFWEHEKSKGRWRWAESSIHYYQDYEWSSRMFTFVVPAQQLVSVEKDAVVLLDKVRAKGFNKKQLAAIKSSIGSKATLYCHAVGPDGWSGCFGIEIHTVQCKPVENKK